MYFLHLVLTFTPHYIITDKGLLQRTSMKLYDIICENNASYKFKILRLLGMLRVIQ